MKIHQLAWFKKSALAVGAALMLSAPAHADEVSEVSSLLRAKQFSAALAKADTYLEGRGDDAQMRFLKGLVLSAMNRREDAIALFSKLSADYPALPEPYNNLAVLYAAGGQYDKARGALEKAVEANPGYARAHENLADVYAQLASQSYANMLRLEPDNAGVRAKQALLRSAIGGRDERVAAPATASTGAAQPAPSQLARGPAHAAAEARSADTPANAERAEVLAALQDWARAWSERDTAAYLDFYSAEFRPARRQSRTRWETERRARIDNKSFIEVQIGSPVVVIESGRARVQFDQSYKSDRINENGRKTLTWEKQDGKWKIVREEGRT